jgi:hypothetical protein
MLTSTVASLRPHPQLPPGISQALYDYAPQWSPWLYASGENLQAVVRDVIAQALMAERVLPKFKRTRARRADDLEIFKGIIEALVAHVVYEYWRGAGVVSISLSKTTLGRASRYLSPLQSEQLPKILALLSSPELNFLTVIPGTKATVFTEGRLTRILAGPRLINRIDGTTIGDIDRKDGEEIVLLKSDRDDRTGIANLIDYPDSELADGYRSEIARINAHLLAADIEYRGSSVLFDEGKRHLVRRFTRGQWGCGGRLWGGFWDSPMTKQNRLQNIRINSERVVSVDFSSMVVRLAYAHVGVEPPASDLYESITFIGTNGQPVALPRAVVKKIVAARLNGAKDWPEELRGYRTGLPWRAVVAALKESHAPIADIFDQDLGQQLAFTESEILVDALLRLIEQDVTALPLHDCVLVAESDEIAATGALLDSFKFHTNQTARITIERASQENCT